MTNDKSIRNIAADFTEYYRSKIVRLVRSKIAAPEGMAVDTIKTVVQNVYERGKIMRLVLIVLFVVIILQAVPRDSQAFWWPFNKKQEKPEVMPQPSYDIGRIEYRHQYGDAVIVLGSDNEFVICETCSPSTVLERVLTSVPVSIRLSAPSSATAAVLSTPGSGETGTLGDLSHPTERSIIADPCLDKPLKETRNDPASQTTTTVSAPPSPDSIIISQRPGPGINPDYPVAIIYFPFDSSEVSQSDNRKIQDILDSLKGKSVEVIGYTCDLGTKEYNDRLAVSRAKAVANVLEVNGVMPASVSGKGKCCYVSGDKTLNRRVEIRDAK